MNTVQYSSTSRLYHYQYYSRAETRSGSVREAPGGGNVAVNAIFPHTKYLYALKHLSTPISLQQNF
ncbi:MAG TPA: hypothetical protein VF884_00745 [Nitrososphaeraceae archaeon]